MSNLLCIEVYADGAVPNNGQAGWMGYAAVGLHRGRTKEKAARLHSERATNNQAELLAIKLAAELVKPEKRGETHLMIFSDSQWAVRVLNRVYKTELYPELIAEIRSLLRSYGCAELQWLRGHVGHRHNERANDLAQQIASAK